MSESDAEHRGIGAAYAQVIMAFGVVFIAAFLWWGAGLVETVYTVNGWPNGFPLPPFFGVQLYLGPVATVVICFGVSAAISLDKETVADVIELWTGYSLHTVSEQDSGGESP